ncbi:hypothetical protein [Rheinheimera baltica]|uniref:hypothetical protein n=1 Tax=Rheinheimera baltica TaxID=67576 RepID=UPI00041BEBAB|nr:hypothetical protein [Rheinheimera baltica]
MTLNSVFSIYLSLFTATFPAAALVPILDVYPRCDYSVKQHITTVSRAGSSQQDANSKSADVLQDALLQLQQQASGKGDAIILTKVIGQLSKDRIFFSNEKAETEIIYRLGADVISLCTEDNSKPFIATPFDTKGMRQVDRNAENDTTIKMVINTTISATSKQQAEIDDASISLNTGFHGATLGSSRQQLEDIFGPAESFFQYEDDYFMLAYGNQLWLTFANNQLVQAKHTSENFTYDLTSQLLADRHPKLADWQLDNLFSKRSLLPELKAHYTTALSQLTATEYFLQQQQAIIRLIFSEYLDIESSQQQIKLTDISLEHAELPPLPALQLPTLKDISTEATQPAMAPLQKANWEQMLNNLPATNYSTTKEQKRLQLYRPELAAVYAETGLSEVQFSLLTQNSRLTQLQQLLALFSLPTTRQQFITQHPDAFETNGRLVVYHDMLEINATFTDNDKIDSFIVKWF